MSMENIHCRLVASLELDCKSDASLGATTGSDVAFFVSLRTPRITENAKSN